MKKQIYIFFILSFLWQPFDIFSQFQSEYFNSSYEKPVDSAKLTLNLNAAGFFHNNEFFNTDVEGYTLTGNYIQPSFIYSINENLRIGAGIHLLKYNGEEGFNKTQALLNISYDALNNLEILLGSYNGGDNFLMTEALYARELNFTNLVNNGVRIKFHSQKIYLQTWLDWERFIEYGDPFREEFSFGTNFAYTFPENEKYNLKIPLYIMVNHKGGQINNNNQPVETIADLSTGVNYSRKLDINFIDSLTLEGLIFLENDISSQQSGTAFYIGTEISKSLVAASVGYFHAKNWESVHGNPLLFAGDLNSERTKNIILLKAGIGKNITKKSTFSLRFEGYYDLGINKFQYLYGLYLVVNEPLRILK
ncbi:MAG: hypothetical protein K9I80_13055 [Ignavibacteriales bacterium]|nr:hypothetical protein [Ignavibacteriales bacterium]MCF8406155.1 hypothetical protein [Bacteroidales bacterium]